MPPTSSLWPAILGLPAADSAAAPREHTPDSWRVLLARHPDAALGVFQLCTGGRDWVLSTSPSATVQLDCTAQHPAWQWHRHVAAVADALHTRGTLPTALQVHCNETFACAAQASVLFTGLRDAARSVQALDLYAYRTPLDSDSEPLSKLLQCAAQTFSGLRSLTLRGAGSWVLPAPALLPQLQRLSVKEIRDVEASRLARSIAAHVPQLISLEFDTYEPILEDLFPSTQAPSQTLTHLTVREDLTDESLQALLTQAPALQSLLVGELHVIMDVFQDRVWGVTEFKTSQAHESGQVNVTVLARLPTCADGGITRFDIGDECVRFTVVDKKGLHPDIVSRLRQWQFTAPKYEVMLGHMLQPAEQVAALQAVLQQLGPVLRAPHTTDVCWASWRWDTAMADALVSAKAGLPHVALTVDVSCLSDTQIGPLLHMGTATLKSVKADSIYLETDQHAESVWPWAELSLFQLNVSQLTHFPRPAPGKTLTIGAWDGVSITNGVTRVDQSQLLERLQHIRLGFLGEQSHEVIRIHLLCPQPQPNNPTSTNTHTSLSAQLAVLSAIQFDPNTVDTSHIYTHDEENPVRVYLEDWPLTTDTIEALQGLPHWNAAVRLFFNDMPLTPSECAKLAEYIPVSYCEWLVRDVSEAQLEAICGGIEARRKGLGLPRLRVSVLDYEEDGKEWGEHVYIGSDWY